MDNWDSSPFADPMQPVVRPSEDSAELAVDDVPDPDPGNVREWWVAPADHTQEMEPGFYSFFQTIFIINITAPPHCPPYSGTITLTMQLLDAAGAVLSEVILECTVATDAGPPLTWDFTAGAIDLSNAVPVATFNGVRFSVDQSCPPWPYPSGTLLVLGGAKVVELAGGTPP